MYAKDWFSAINLSLNLKCEFNNNKTLWFAYMKSIFLNTVQ